MIRMPTPDQAVLARRAQIVGRRTVSPHKTGAIAEALGRLLDRVL
jgi:hypothetical protein